MPDVSAYPLLRTKRRRRRWRVRVDPARVRLAAVLLAALTLLAALLWASRPGPPDPAAALAEARTTLAAGNYNAARSNALRAVTANGRSPAAQLILAEALLELGEGLAAEAALDRAKQAGAPPEQVHHLAARARLLQGDAAGALDRVEIADPRHAGDLARVRAGALASRGQGAAAQAVLEERLARDARDARAWTALGRLRLAADEMGAAADAAATAVRLAPGEPAALTLQGEVVRTRFGLVAALPWFEAALKRDAFYHPALIEYAATLGEAGRHAEALAVTRDALKAKPGSPPALYLQAVIAARAGKPDLARRLLAATGGALDAMPGALLLGGAVDAATGRGEEAVTRWRRLVAAQPMNIAARRLLGAALLQSGDPTGALDVLRPVALRGDADSYALLVAARGWEAASRRTVAAGLIDRSMAVAAAEPALFASDENAGALLASAAVRPGDPTYALSLIRAATTGGDTGAGLSRARALAAAAPRDPAALLALGDVLAAAGRDGEAAIAYRRAADLRFDEPTALRLIDQLSRARRPDEAAAALALYLGQNPQSVSARRVLGHWQVSSGRWNEAIETLEGVRRQIGNRDAALLADLALAYAGDDANGGGGAVARRYGRAAYALAPMNPSVADAYGVALAADGAVGPARQLFDKAIALAPGNPVYLAHRRQLG